MLITIKQKLIAHTCNYTLNYEHVCMFENIYGELRMSYHYMDACYPFTSLWGPVIMDDHAHKSFNITLLGSFIWFLVHSASLLKLMYLLSSVRRQLKLQECMTMIASANLRWL